MSEIAMGIKGENKIPYRILTENNLVINSISGVEIRFSLSQYSLSAANLIQALS